MTGGWTTVWCSGELGRALGAAFFTEECSGSWPNDDGSTFKFPGKLPIKFRSLRLLQFARHPAEWLWIALSVFRSCLCFIDTNSILQWASSKVFRWFSYASECLQTDEFVLNSNNSVVMTKTANDLGRCSFAICGYRCMLLVNVMESRKAEELAFCILQLFLLASSI